MYTKLVSVKLIMNGVTPIKFNMRIACTPDTPEKIIKQRATRFIKEADIQLEIKE